MIDEVLEGGVHTQIMIVDLRNMAHSFVFHNVELMSD